MFVAYKNTRWINISCSHLTKYVPKIGDERIFQGFKVHKNSSMNFCHFKFKEKEKIKINRHALFKSKNFFFSPERFVVFNSFFCYQIVNINY